MISPLDARVGEKKRNSNVELLRFALMLAICVWHTFVHGFNYKEIGMSLSTDISVIRLMIMCMCVPAVNTFMLISGYYGIRLSTKKVFHFWFLGVAVVLMCIPWFHISHIASYVFPMSSGVWWFMKCYFLVMAFSPLIENGLRNADKTLLFKIVLFLLFINSVVKMANFTCGGSDFISLLIVFIIGRAFKRFEVTIPLHKALSLVALSSLGLFVMLLYFKLFGNKANIWISLGYNNPLIIIQSIGILYGVLHIPTHHFRLFNFLGKNSLAIYLITELLGVSFMYKWWAILYDENKTFYLFVIIVIALACTIVGSLIGWLGEIVVCRLNKPLIFFGSQLEAWLTNKKTSEP